MNPNGLEVEAEVRELRNRVKGSYSPVVSLYLDRSLGGNYESELNSMLREKEKLLAELDFSSGREQLTRKLLNNLRKRVEQLERPDGRELFISYSGDGFRQEYRFPVSMPSKLIIQPEPYIRPLESILEQFDRYFIAVIDRGRSRFFTSYLGRFQEEDISVESEVPGQVSEDDTGKGARASLKSKGGTGREAWGGWKENKIQAHIEDHFQRYLKGLAVLLRRLTRKQNIDHLVLAGPKGEEGEIVQGLRPHLNRDVKEKIIGTFSGGSKTEKNEIRGRFKELVRDFRLTRETKLLNRLFAESDKPEGLGVLGIEATLEALFNGKVKTLVLSEDVESAGWICPDDYYVSPEQEECPVCGEMMKVTEDLFGHMVWEAIDQNSEIFFVREAGRGSFAEAAVGALLRF